MEGMMEARHRRLDQAVLTPLTRAPRGYVLWVTGLVAIVGWGFYAYSTQVSSGLIVTAMGNEIMWGLYISHFVFFIGISHAGTLISAILRVTQAPWRMPITRMAEFITVVALMIGASMPLIDMGRPDRVLNLLLYGRWQSPLLWDVLAITTYLAGSLIYLYLPLIPDLALCRDAIAHKVSPLKRWFYNTFSIGWAGTRAQHKKLASAMGMMMVVIMPVAVSVHTVVSWIFAMNLRPGWNSTVFGIYFVAGAIFSGIATIIIVMAVLRKLYHLEEFITEKHFRYLGYLMGVFSVIMIYFNLSEHLTTGYKVAEGDEFLLTQLMTGTYSSSYWVYAVGGLVVPVLLVFLPWTRTIVGVVVAALLVDVGMWLERFLIVVAPLRVPLMPYEPASYSPTWVEWSIIAAAFAAFMLMITLFSRLFPVISVWEVKEQEERELAVPPRPVPERAVPIPESSGD
jgi:molybdopterin-containing oxidoreductase family membrane subunit